MLSNKGFCIFWPSAWHYFSCSHLWRALKVHVTHFVEISRKILAFWTVFIFQGYTGSCNSINTLALVVNRVTLAQDKNLLEPHDSILLLRPRHTNFTASSRQERDVVITPGWLWFTRLDEIVTLSSGMCLQCVGSLVSEPTTSSALPSCPCHVLFAYLIQSDKLIFGENISKRYVWFVSSLLCLSMYCKTGNSGVSSSCLQLICWQGWSWNHILKVPERQTFWKEESGERAGKQVCFQTINMQIGNNWGTRTRRRENKTNHKNRSSDELVFLVVGKRDKVEKEETKTIWL